MSKIAIIGGKGLELPDYLKKTKKLTIDTPFGSPTPVVYSGYLEGVEILHLSRDGKGKKSPQEPNHWANLYALKKLDCGQILATATSRSLREEVCPGEIIILDQFIDMTATRLPDFLPDREMPLAEGLPMDEPFSEELRDHLVEAAIVLGFTVHTKGVVLSAQGSRFSSRAESNLFRSWGADVINTMTAPEVILANELGIPYAALILCTGYDSWRVRDDSSDPCDGKVILEESHDKMIRMLTYAVRKIEQNDQGEL